MNIEVKNNVEFYLGDKRFYVFYKERGPEDYDLLKRGNFEINETDIGYELIVKKLGGYVGLNIPIFSNLILGNQFYEIDNYNKHYYCYNKAEFGDAYDFDEEDYTELRYPVFHDIISNNSALSISPSSDEEVIITPYRDYFNEYVRIQTYSHIQNDYIRFFFDQSASYHLNLRRVSSDKSDCFYFDKQSSIVDYQEVLYNNLDIVTVDQNDEKLEDLKNLAVLFENEFGSDLVFTGKFSLWLNDYLENLPNEVEAVFVDNLRFGNFHTFKVNFMNQVDIFEWNNFKNVSFSREKAEVVLELEDMLVKINFSEDWNGTQNRIKSKNGFTFLIPEAELERKIMKSQSLSFERRSKKELMNFKQKVGKLAWKIKSNEDFTEYSIVNMIGSVSNSKYSDYFLDYFKLFDFDKFNYIRTKILKNKKDGFIDVRINRPFFVSVFEDLQCYYLVVINNQYCEEECRMVIGEDIEKVKWMAIRNDKDGDVTVEDFVDHNEIYIKDVKFGGLAILSKK